MSRISDRHESDLGGRFRPFTDTEVTAITVVISPNSAHLAPVQHTGWMLINLLARLEGVVESIGFVCPPGVALQGKIVPFAPAENDFRTAVLQGAKKIGIVTVVPDMMYNSILEVGIGIDAGSVGLAQPISKRRLYVYGEGWWGGVSQEEIGGTGHSPLPFGPYTAACFAVAEVYKAARMNPDSYEPVRSVFYSTWLHQSGVTPPLGGPDTIGEIGLDVALAGVGAVGSTWVHALWACPGLSGSAVLADSDLAGVDRTNLNRYPLFGLSSVGKSKASEAVRVCGCGNENIEWVAFDGPFEELSDLPPRIISAVDKNRARLTVQLRYPARLLSASTRNLRAEVLRCGPPGIGACLHCFNPVEAIPTDEEIRAHLAEMADEELTLIGEQAVVGKDELKNWIQNGRCGQASARLLPFLRQSGNGNGEGNSGQPDFAVSFVSVMAGTLLAAETVKDYFAVDVPLNDDLSRAAMQFWTPTVHTSCATSYRRESGCTMCAPSLPSVSIWNKRYYGLEPLRQA